ncbi:hypothetical protein QM787_03535 [Rhodococcus ruber]|nr:MULTISPECIES: hypothetical protein [Rhodococcus]MBP2210597.1 hypothetical protein [Rhodococcus ruber]MCZ4503848.1 hypothetical protein [Rhodococcus ruber]MCZ4529535.1 hypothetical protein [Rhodococcus ruber]MCZ4623675.1 hypothetical protein [Rhodococcus ruber]MDI9966914.1 hypothetical protein [Rhodococcus ruber]
MPVTRRWVRTARGGVAMRRTGQLDDPTLAHVVSHLRMSSGA